jgi:hypothetical protein
VGLAFLDTLVFGCNAHTGDVESGRSAQRDG